MRRHILILLVLWGLFSTGAAIYFWNSNQKLKEVNNTLSESNEVHRRLVENEYKSYQTINDCFVVKKGLCDPEDFKSNLQTLSDAADGLYEQISAFNKQLNVQRP